MAVYAKAIDELSHFFYEAGVPEAEELGHSSLEIERYRDVMDRTYEWTDRQIAPLVDAVDRDGNTLLVLVSDHGWEKEADGNYNHSYAPPGILVLYGAGVCSRVCPALADARVYDIAPTILVQLGLPISDEMVGRPLSEAFREEHKVLRVARYGDPLMEARAIPSEIDAALTEKLKALGYMD